jgi:hypothetical protein
VWLVPSLAKSGLLGDSIAESFIRNSLVSGVNPLFAGRPEIAVSLSTASLRPIMGWGEMPPATPAIILRAASIARSLGINVNSITLNDWAPDGRVSAHSEFMQLWITGGVAGLLMAILILAALLRFLFVGGIAERDIVTLYLCMQVSWDLLFSPLAYGAEVLLLTAAFLSVARGNVNYSKTAQRTPSELAGG